PTQNVEDHAGFHGLNGTLNCAAGLLLDAQWGLLLAAPVAILALAAFGPWLRSQRQRALLTLCSVTPYLLVVAAYQVWWGEWGPTARYLVPIVPLLAALLAAWLSMASPLQRLTASGMWIIGFILTMVVYTNPQ